MTARRDQPKPANGVRCGRDGLAHPEGLEDGSTLGRDSAAAGLVTRKILAIHDDDTFHAELSKMQRRGEASRSGTDDANISMGDVRLACFDPLLLHYMLPY